MFILNWFMRDDVIGFFFNMKVVKNLFFLIIEVFVSFIKFLLLMYDYLDYN